MVRAFDMALWFETLEFELNKNKTKTDTPSQNLQPSNHNLLNSLLPPKLDPRLAAINKYIDNFTGKSIRISYSIVSIIKH